MDFKLSAALIIIAVARSECLEYPKTEPHKCESNLNQTSDFWIEKYGMTENIGFIHKVIQYSDYIFENAVPGDFGLLKAKETHNYVHFFSLYKTPQIYPFRRNKVLGAAILHFIRGDSVVIHMIDPNSKNYSFVELGYKTLRFTLEIPLGVWYTIDPKLQNKDSFALLGITLVLKPTGKYVFEYSDRKDLIQEFPQHASIINKFY